MTSKHLSGQTNVLPFPGGFRDNRRATGDKNQPLAHRRINLMWTDERLCGVGHCVIWKLFGKRHWVTEWVIGLCEADPQFLFHLAEQPRGYAHFICLVRLALLEQPGGNGNALRYAELLQTKSRRAALKSLLPDCPAGILGVLPKLRKKPFPRKNYRQLIQSLADKRTCKRLYHAKRVLRDDLVLFEMINTIPKEFQSAGIIRSLKTFRDCEYIRWLIGILQHVGFTITKQEVENETSGMNSMPAVAAWLRRKLESLPFPPPPWHGNERIKPVCSRQELKNASKRFKNCIMDHLFGVVAGCKVVYVCKQPDAMILLKKDNLFGWEVNDISGINNESIDAACKRKIKQEFYNARICPIPIVIEGGEISALRYYGEHIFEYESVMDDWLDREN